ncbi:MAG: ATP phosphoribosyltransferase [Planctomycetes bacterium]|nr:ATP phosphoribosyltransferase [Planctomycetota bacterium]MBU1517929.1 ATP phosphoribosyltransferase [Planctomycetota bacterium]MBU2458184.1 ATP phosphoribosyltransferase [Planctomycetota bacterium]MBU2596301.1 ATP phosphoribosyltransferase [Planctomycetota bacterium]
MSEKILKLGIPKGSLEKATFALFEKAGFNIAGYERSCFPRIDDEQIQLIMLRAQEMSRYVEDGVLDAGFTGHDWILENKSSVHEVCELLYSKATSKPARWVLVVPSESKVKKTEDLKGGIIATELVGVTKEYFKKKGIDVKVEFSWGATEVKARLVNAIVELTETGSSLKANNLRIIDTLLTSTTRFIANKAAWKDKFKREKIENISILLNAAIDAKTTVGLKMNVEKDRLADVIKILPAEKSPTVSSLADSDFVAVEVVVDTAVERIIVPKLKRAGASGIITYPLNKVIH